jgi:hypothetical protein
VGAPPGSPSDLPPQIGWIVAFSSSESVVADAAGTFAAAWTDLTTVNNTGVEAVDAVTSAPESGFGAATTFPVSLLDNLRSRACRPAGRGIS